MIIPLEILFTTPPGNLWYFVYRYWIGYIRKMHDVIYDWNASTIIRNNINHDIFSTQWTLNIKKEGSTIRLIYFEYYTQ